MDNTSPSNNRFSKKNRSAFLLNNAIYIVLIVLLGIIIALSPDFVSIRNFRNILSQASTRMIIALGVGGLIITQGTDLSAGRMVGLSAVISASLLQAPEYTYRMYPQLAQLPVFVPMLIAAIVTGFFGMINCFVISKLKVTPIIATNVMMIIK